MALISSMEATHIKSRNEDNESRDEKTNMLNVQIKLYLKYFGVKLDHPSGFHFVPETGRDHGTKWNLLI
jgi:hypothetical protein